MPNQRYSYEYLYKVKTLIFYRFVFLTNYINQKNNVVFFLNFFFFLDLRGREMSNEVWNGSVYIQKPWNFTSIYVLISNAIDIEVNAHNHNKHWHW